jgi:hypothetical protein
MPDFASYLDLSHPLTQTAVLPLAAGAIGAGVLRLIAGPSLGPRVAAAAVVIALLASYVATLGLPPWPPRAAIHKIAYVAALGGIAGIVLALLPRLRGQAAPLALAGIAATVIWLGWNRITDFGPNAETLKVLGVAIAGYVVLYRSLADAGDGQGESVNALVHACGAGAIALIGNSAALAQLCFAAAAAIGGFLLWNWPKARFAYAPVAAFGATGAVVAMTLQMSMFTRASAPALMLLGVVAFADVFARPLQPSGGTLAPAARPIIQGLVAAVVAGAAIGLAHALDAQP